MEKRLLIQIWKGGFSTPKEGEERKYTNYKFPSNGKTNIIDVLLITMGSRENDLVLTSNGNNLYIAKH